MGVGRCRSNRETGDCRGLSHEACSRRQSTSTSGWSHAQEDGHNYEMVYASEVSSTCWVKSQSGDFGGGDDGDWGTGPCLLGPAGLEEELGKQGKFCGEGGSCKRPSLRSFPGVGAPLTERRGTLEIPGSPRFAGTNGAWPPSSLLPRLPFEAGGENAANHSSASDGTQTCYQTTTGRHVDVPSNRTFAARRSPRQACPQNHPCHPHSLRLTI